MYTETYTPEMAGLFKTIGKIGKGVVKGAKAIFKGGKQVGQWQGAATHPYGLYGSFPGSITANQPLTNQAAAIEAQIAQIKLQKALEGDKMPQWVIPAGIAGFGLLILMVVMTSRRAA